MVLWMLNYGARNFIFAPRSGLDRQKSRDTVALLRDQGARTFVSRCDVGKADDFDRLLRECGRELPPMRGMIHGAFVSKVRNLFNSNIRLWY